MSSFARMRALLRCVTLVAGVVVLIVATLTFCSRGALAGSPADTSHGASISAAVGTLSETGILRGRDSSPLTPHGYVTRAQLTVFLARALDLDESMAASEFTDVGHSAWCAGAIGAMCRAGLVRGVTPTTFAPDELVSRQQAITWIVDSLDFKIASEEMFARLHEQVDFPSDPDPESTAALRLSSLVAQDAWLAGFRDRLLIDSACAQSVANGYRLGFVDPHADGRLYPELPLSWGDMAVMLERAFIRPVDMRRGHPAALLPAESYPDLTLGSDGPLVLYVEDRLRGLSYRPGPIDGVYDERTRDAVLAFQKVERLQRDGIAGPDFWRLIFTAETPAPKLVGEGIRVEVDLARQVLFMITHNKVWKIVHVSTGRGGTPIGPGEVILKQPGWNSGRLGSMYYVSYFRPHYAIHGMLSVPSYPASHGCVRVPIWMAVELFYELPLGTKVDIYHE